MERKSMTFPDGVTECIEATGSGGTILCAGDMDSYNGMTIGWVSFGVIWGQPACTVLVRPSRHTFGFMDKGTFTVNVLPKALKDAVGLFGSESGRDMDKFVETGLTPVKGEAVGSPYIREASLVFECSTLYSQAMDESLVSAEFGEAWYPGGDFHKIYYGKVVSIHGS